MSFQDAFLHISADFYDVHRAAQSVQRMEEFDTLAVGVTWTDDGAPLDITGGTVTANAVSASGQEVALSPSISDAVAGQVLVSDDPGTLSRGYWVVTIRLTLNGTSRSTRCRLQVLASPGTMPGSAQPVEPDPIAPTWAVNGDPFFTVPDPEVGDVLTIDPGSLDGSAPIDIAFEYLRLDGVDRTAETSGLSWDSTGESAGTVTAQLRATNAAGSVLSIEISVVLTAVSAGNTFVATVADLVTTDDVATADLVFDSGAAFGNDAASIPTTGTTDAPDGTDIEVRTVLVSDGTEVDTWQVVAQANSSGTYSGTFTATRAAGNAFVRREARPVGSSAAAGTETTRFKVGHVVMFMGQSEIYRAMSYSGGYDGVMNTDQFQIVSADFEFGGGSGDPGEPVTGFIRERGYLYPTSGIEPMATHAADFFQKHTGDPVMILVGAQSAHGRNDLGADGKDQRRWSDLISVLDGGGYQDGVRPGIIVDMWTNRDGNSSDGYATDFLSFVKPFYTGLAVDGSTYNLGDGYDVETFTGTPGTNDETIVWDHCLFDLSGGARGIFDETETKIILCHHRYDLGTDQQNAILDQDPFGGSMLGQELIREALFGEVIEDTHIAQIAVRGTEPMNYKNGAKSGAWGDFIHPGTHSEDGLPLFARHLAHAACQGLGLTATVIAEFDTIDVDPAGAYADISWSGGDITTTRKLRGLPDLDGSQTHWTDVFGFEFNGRPVERAEIVDASGAAASAGKVRVYTPTGAGSGAGGVADWEKDHIHFGRGGGTGRLLAQEDSEAETWLNYPVTDSAPAGLVDDQRSNAQQGVAVRPLKQLYTPEFAANTVVAKGSRFVDPQGVLDAAGADATSFRFEFRGALPYTQEKVRLFSIGDRVECFLTRSLNVRAEIWSGGGTHSTSTLDFVPGAMGDQVIEGDMVANTLQWWIDGTLALDATIEGAQNKFVNADQISILGIATDPEWTFDLQRAAVWLNYTTGAATPVDTGTTPPYKEILASVGAGPLNSDPWKGGADLVPFDPAPAGEAGAPEINISSEQDMRDHIQAVKLSPSLANGAELVLAEDLDLTSIQGADWAGAFPYNSDWAPTVIRSANPARPARLRNIVIRPVLIGDGTEVGNLTLDGVLLDQTHFPLLDFKDDNHSNAWEACISGNNAHTVVKLTVKSSTFWGSYPDYRYVNRDTTRRAIGIQLFNSRELLISHNKWRHMGCGMILGTQHSVIEYSDFRMNNEDFIRWSAQNIDGVRADTFDIQVNCNLVADFNARNRWHPDLVQMGLYGQGVGTAKIRDITYNRTVFYEGISINCPIYPTGTLGDDSDPRAVLYDAPPATLPATVGKVHRIRAHLSGGTTTLPAGMAPGDWLAVQIEATDQPVAPVTVMPPAGVTLDVQSTLEDISATGYVLERVNQTIKVEMQDNGALRVFPHVPNHNIQQINYAASEGEIENIVWNDTIVWSNATNGIRTGGNINGCRTNRALFLRALPGDVTGNSKANTHADGVWIVGRAPTIDMADGADNECHDSAADHIDAGGASGNNLDLDFSDNQAIIDLFVHASPSGDGVRHRPTTPLEAIEHARHAVASVMDTASIGPVGTTEAQDPVDWSFVADFDEAA